MRLHQLEQVKDRCPNLSSTLWCCIKTWCQKYKSLSVPQSILECICKLSGSEKLNVLIEVDKSPASCATGRKRHVNPKFSNLDNKLCRFCLGFHKHLAALDSYLQISESLQRNHKDTVVYKVWKPHMLIFSEIAQWQRDESSDAISSPPCFAGLGWIRFKLGDAGRPLWSVCLRVFSFRIFSFDYSAPAGSRVESKVTSAVGCLFIELQDEIFNDQEIQSFSKHINIVEYFKVVLKNVHPCQLNCLYLFPLTASPPLKIDCKILRTSL